MKLTRQPGGLHGQIIINWYKTKSSISAAVSNQSSRVIVSDSLPLSTSIYDFQAED